MLPRFSALIQKGPGAHWASCIMGSVSRSRRYSGRAVTLITRPHIPPTSSWPLLVWNITFTCYLKSWKEAYISIKVNFSVEIENTGTSGGIIPRISIIGARWVLVVSVKDAGRLPVGQGVLYPLISMGGSQSSSWSHGREENLLSVIIIIIQHQFLSLGAPSLDGKHTELNTRNLCFDSCLTPLNQSGIL